MLRRKSKYNNKKVVYDGITFDSIVEKDRYKYLKAREQEGHIHNLQLQKQYILQESFKYHGKTIRAITYKADFFYVDDEGYEIIEDVKGVLTPEFKLKAKLFKKRYPFIVFKIVTKAGGRWETSI